MPLQYVEPNSPKEWKAATELIRQYDHRKRIAKNRLIIVHWTMRDGTKRSRIILRYRSKDQSRYDIGGVTREVWSLEGESLSIYSLTSVLGMISLTGGTLSRVRDHYLYNLKNDVLGCASVVFTF